MKRTARAELPSRLPAVRRSRRRRSCNSFPNWSPIKAGKQRNAATAGAAEDQRRNGHRSKGNGAGWRRWVKNQLLAQAAEEVGPKTDVFGPPKNLHRFRPTPSPGWADN